MSTSKPREERAAEARAAAGRLAEQEIEGVVLGWVDNAGITRTKAVPLARLEHAARWGVGASPAFDAFLLDDSMAPTGSPVGDLRLVPDLARLVPLAAQPGWAWAPVDRYRQDGSEHPGCQRRFARRMAAELGLSGITAQTGIEVEWITDPAEDSPAYGMTRLIAHSDYLRDLLRACRRQELAVLQLHPEYARGQFELSVAPEGPVEAADTTLLLRQTIRAVSQQYGLRVSFAPAFSPGQVGNGGHLHLSLWREQRNLFAEGPGRYGLTPEAEAFLAGVLDELPGLLALGAPSVASYLRLEPDRWAGAYQCWGMENREAALRLITGSAPEQANAEVKCFDLAANPYLMVGGVLAAGLAGLTAMKQLPAETAENPSGTTAPRLPDSLPAALAAFRGSPVLRDALGDELFHAVFAVREAEAVRFGPDGAIDATRWRY